MIDSKGNIVPRKTEYRVLLEEAYRVLEKFLRSSAEVRSSQLAARAEVNKLAHSSDFTPAYIERKIAELDDKERKQSQEGYEKALELIDKLVAIMEVRHSEPLDLGNEVFVNFLALINMSGHKLEQGELSKFVDLFVNDPPALKALQAVFENIQLERGIDLVKAKIYEPAVVARELREASRSVFLQQPQGSLNNFASLVSKTAKKEGITFPKDGEMVDPIGHTMAIRAAAGLPAEA